MKSFTISAKTPFRFGVGTALEAAAKFQELGCKKVFVVLDPGIEKLGLHKGVFASMEEAGIEMKVYDNVMPDPTDVAINEAGEKYKAAGCRGILGFGGGSALDLAKGVKCLSKNEGPISKYYGRTPMENGDPMILLATTIGTGAEVSIAAVISDTGSGKKPAILNPKLQADLAVMDPTFSYGLPQKVMACCVMDIMLHCCETVTSTYRNPNSEIMALAALKIAVANYDNAVNGQGDAKKAAIEELSFASSYAALAFNDSMIHVGHHLAHFIGAVYHTPHGQCCSVVIPEFCKYFAKKMPEEMKKIANACGIDENAADLGEKLNMFFKNISRKIGLVTAKELGWEPETMYTLIPGIHGRVVEPNATTPFDVTEDDLKMLIDRIYEG
ncbi:MAG: iron-containing alcohol dehydrogenase [Eubacterium sp.]|nr:iron-containing alcohol dehydrogenase [Eubacterium sp.]